MTENPLSRLTAPHRILLASKSPRRQHYFRELGLSFELVSIDVAEEYPPHLSGAAIARYLAVLKADAYDGEIQPMDILITADTVVWQDKCSLAKPQNSSEARDMLQQLSGHWHEVITAVCFRTQLGKKVVSSTTRVKFKALSKEEIGYYVDHFRPYDKAGGYGIQEWIGFIGIEELQGSYTNVVGLPTELVYKTLMDMVS